MTKSDIFAFCYLIQVDIGRIRAIIDTKKRICSSIWAHFVHTRGGFVAENDRFEKHLGAGWRTAANYAEGEKASVEEIGDKIIESLVNYLRDYNGVPSFQEIVLVLKAPVGPSPTEHFSTLEDIVRDQKGHRHTKVAAYVAMSLLVISRALC